MNDSVDKFASKDMMSSQICDDDAPQSPSQVMSNGADGSMEPIECDRCDTAGHCSGGVCSLNWKPLRPAA